ncbi:MAG: asparaginase [Erysipelotrichaceae bacterium]|nr:asparaginase [Erysipelotrichaceae bacterium]MDY5251144.1 asparaginase [Erysipelotrichaceae bacterium]
MKKICWITTGGTIASVKSADGYVAANKGEVLYDLLGTMTKQYEIEVCDLFTMDSSNIQPEEWKDIAACVNERLAAYDGFVITHGTDTMAYTASCLSFMLLNVHKPVVLTGSQLPLIHPLSDGLENMRLALAMASSDCPGVFVAFNRKIILGTRAVKVRTTGFHAFESVNFPYIATVNSLGLDLHPEYLPTKGEPYIYNDSLCTEVFLLKLIPGMNPKIFDMLIKLDIKGVVIEAFGIGGLSYIRRDFTQRIVDLLDAGISVVVCSQCLYERSDFSVYEVGKKALEHGVIEAYDMTSETCVTKLMWILGQTNDPQKIRELFKHNFANEIKQIKKQ